MHLLQTILVAFALSSGLCAQVLGSGFSVLGSRFTCPPGKENHQRQSNSEARAPNPEPERIRGDVQDSGIWLDVPFFAQKENGCGASSLAMVIRYWRDHLPAGDPDAILSRLYSEELKGIPASRLTEYLEENGFRSFTFRGDLSEVKKHLSKGRPLIVSLKRSTLHYVVVVGLDEQEKVVLLNDPAGKKLAKMDEREFLRAWKPTDYWTLLAVPDGTLQ